MGSIDNSEYHHVSRGRGHQLHSHHSHEASGGESADGSRPGTPLCDELPDGPSEPRRLPSKASSLETRTPRPILTLPLPKFGIPFFQKHRTSAGTLSASLASGSLSMASVNSSSNVNSSINSSSMVSNSLLNSVDCGPGGHSSLYKQKSHQQHSSSTSSSSSTMRPRSLSSNSSDSELNDDGGIAERIKFVDEMYEKWSGNKDHHHVQHYMPPTQQPPKLIQHKLLEFDIKEVPSSDIAKSLMAKKSIFDDDFQRLAIINNKKEEDKSEIIPLPKPSIPNLGVTKVPVVGPNQPPLPPPSPVVQPPAAPTTPYQRLNSSTNSSPMNSPQPTMSSPYNSPSGASGAFKGLQYPFPSHTPISSHSVSPVSSSAPKPAEPQPQQPPQQQKVLNKSNSLPNDIVASNPKQLKHSASVGSAASISAPIPNTSQPQQQPCPKKSEKNPEKSSHKEKKASKDEEKKEKEKEKKEREKREKEERDRKEKEERELREKEQRERELKEQKEKEQRERELKEQKEREQRERELKEQREKELKEQKERELREQREHELREQREREIKEQKEREQRERELKEQKEREQRERELKEQKEREQREREKQRAQMERELMEQREKELKEQRERELKEQREKEQREKELKEQREREQRERELKEQRDRELKEQRERELREQKEKERKEKLEKSKADSKEEKRNHKTNNNSSTITEPLNPNRNINKRRLSLIDLPLATTYDNVSSKKIRRDSKESIKHNSKERKESSSSSNATPPIEKAASVEQNLLFQPVKVEENHNNMNVPQVNRHRKDSGFEEKHGRKHGSKERTPSSSASKHSKSDEEETTVVPANTHHSHHKKHKSKKDKKSERVKNSSSCSDSERPPNKLPKNLLSSDSDSDHSSKNKSIFEPKEGSPQYVSMYDKVKARSCKNMQKQVDDQKKKDIFSKFKKSREKKKKNSEFDSDSHPVTSSDDENSDSARKPCYNQRLTDLWDQESSEDEEIPQNHKKRNSLSSKRIASDSDSENDVLQQTVIHVPPVPTEPIESEDDMKSAPPSPESKQQGHSDFFGDTASNFSDSKEGSFERQIFSPDSRKRHKKSKKRPKSPTAAEKFESTLLEKKSSAIEDIFDELKRGDNNVIVATATHDKKQKHKERKEKKRHERSDPLMSKEERHRLKKLKKAKAAAEQEAKQRGQKFDNIFGPISDDEDVSSFSETPKLLSPPPTTFKQEPLTPKSHTVEENEENKQKCARDPTSHAERERLRKEKREKKRKEREKSKEQHALTSLQHTSTTNSILPPPCKGDEENSVDMDEAGRALEAQLMEDTTADEETPSIGAVGDNFRLSDPDENSIELRKDEKDSLHILSGSESSHKHKEDKPRRKKKRKKDRKHEPALMSPPPGPFINIDVSTPIAASKPSPSLPCLDDDDVQLSTPTTKSSDLLHISPIPRDKMLISPIPKTPTISAMTPTSSANNSICSNDGNKVKKLDKLIPGFDGELDDKISESAVQSISAELNQSPIIDIVPPESKIPVASPPNAGNVKKEEPEEKKSRVVISQEETEDAVAALLGESFGGSTLDYLDDVLPDEEPDPVKSEDPTEMSIPEEEAEEMRKAVQSLSSENIDLKPDSPNSDLQIDTDTEEQAEEEKPITPIKKELAVETKPAIVPIKLEIKQEDEKKPLIINQSLVEPKVEIQVEFKEEKKELPSPKSNAPVIKLEMKEPIRSPVITPKTELPPPATPPMKIELPNRSPTIQFPMQPPTITIPNDGNLFNYPQITVSPRDQQRLPSPRQQPPVSPIAATALSQQQMSPQAATGAQFINVRVQSPSQNIPRSNNQPQQRSQLSPQQHLVIQQRNSQLTTLSPTGNLVINRINLDGNASEGRTLLVERKPFPTGPQTPQKQIIIQQPVIIKQQQPQNPHQQIIIQQHQIIQRPFQQPQRQQVQHINIHKPHFGQQPASPTIRQQAPQPQNVVIVRHQPMPVPQPTKLPQPQQPTISSIQTKPIPQNVVQSIPQQQNVLIQQTKIPTKMVPSTVLEKEKPKIESPSKESVENNSSVIKSQSAVTPAPPKERENVTKHTIPKENESQQSKDEGDFWSAKEANMESVIKEATKALTPNPENSKPGVIAEQPKESGKNNEAPKHPFPATSAAHPSPAVVRAPAVQISTPAPTPLQNTPPMQSTPSSQPLSAASETDDSENTPEMEFAKNSGKHKKLPRNAKKIVIPEPVPVPEPAGPTRRNATKPAPTGRGRKGRPSIKQQAAAAQVSIHLFYTNYNVFKFLSIKF